MVDFNKVARARQLLDAGAYKEAGEMFVASGELASAARAFVAAKDLFRAAVCYQKAHKPLDAARLYQQIHRWDKAAECFTQAGDTRHAEQALEHLREEQEGGEKPQATGWAHAPIPLMAEIEIESQPPAATAPEPADDPWPAGEIWQLIRAGDIAGAAAICARLGGNAGWNLLAEARTPEAWRGLAETLLQAGDHAVAAEAFQKSGDMLRAAQALSLAGLNEEAAHYFYNLGQKALAAEHLEKAGAWEQAAAIYVKEDLFLEAARCYEKNDDPVKAAALYLKARQADVALPLLQSVAPTHHSFSACRLLAGKILFQKGQNDLAISLLAPLLLTVPTTEDALEAFYQAAVLMELGGATDLAVEAFRRLQATHFNYKDVGQRIQNLTSAAGTAPPPAAAAAAAPGVADHPTRPAPAPSPGSPAEPAISVPAPAAPPRLDDAAAPPRDLLTLRSCSLFHQLGPDELRKLWDIGKSGEVKPGKVLVKAGETAAGLMIVLSGGVTITPDPSNPTLASGFLGVGDYVGLGSLLKGPPQTNALVAQKDTRLLVLPFGALEALLSTEPEMGMRFYRSVAEQLIQTLVAASAKPPRA